MKNEISSVSMTESVWSNPRSESIAGAAAFDVDELEAEEVAVPETLLGAMT